jgi:hypothetical protein
VTKKKRDAFTLEKSWQKMRREMRLLSAIHEYPNNPRTHPPVQLALLAELLKKYGPDQDIVIDGDDDLILKGHGRYRAALLAGLKEFPVTIRSGLSEADKITMRISDNAVSLLSGWDRELIRGEIVQLKALDGDLQLLGFGDAQLVQFTTLPGPPSQSPPVGNVIERECPACGHRGSGEWRPKSASSKKKKR